MAPGQAAVFAARAGRIRGFAQPFVRNEIVFASGAPICGLGKTDTVRL